IKWIHELFCTEYWSTFYGKRNAAQEMERKKKQKFEGERIFFFHTRKIEGGKKQQANQVIKI
ncbi:hypothetical protein ABWK50_01565, partial [Priestia megaterium]|uniref:hypothetical protein n=1 Tax=Priestia megaterium TaxID=1404 RepID=UPI003398ECC3